MAVRQRVRRPLVPSRSILTESSASPAGFRLTDLRPGAPGLSPPEPDSQPSPGGEAAEATTRRPPHLFRGLAGPAPGRVKTLTDPAGGGGSRPHTLPGRAGPGPHPRPLATAPPPSSSRIPPSSGALRWSYRPTPKWERRPPPAPRCHRPASLCPRRGQSPRRRPGRYLADPLVDIEVELPAHIEAEAVAVARLVVEVYEGDADRVRALRVEGAPGWAGCTPSAAAACTDLPGWWIGS